MSVYEERQQAGASDSWAAKSISALSRVSTGQWIFVVFAWAMCVRLFINVLVTGLNGGLTGDELDYNAYAINLLTRHQFIASSGDPLWPADLSRRPPVFPLFLALMYRLFGLGNLSAVRLVQSFSGALLCVVLFILAYRLVDKRTALVTGFVAGVYPYLVYLSSQLRPEPIYFLAVYAGAGLFIGFLETRQLVLGILAGLCWGIAILTHTDWLLAMPLFVVWGLWRLGRNWHNFSRLCIVVGVALAVMFPWTLRNYTVHHEFVLVSTNLGVTLAGSNNPAIARDSIMRGDWLPPEDMKPLIGDLSGLSEVERDRIQTRYALDFILQNPKDFVTLGFWRLVRHWHFYWPLTHPSLPDLAGLALYFIALLLAAFGVFRLVRRQRASDLVCFALLLVSFSTAVAFTIRGGTRYRMLVDPVLIVLASYAVTSAVDDLFKRLRRGVATT